MAVKSPEQDRRPGLSGGADAWDNGPAGQILAADYFVAVDTGAAAVSIAGPQASGAGSVSPPQVVVDEGASTGATFSTIDVVGVRWRVATFAASGNLVVTTGGAAEYLIVAGGASGGVSRGGGGGAGGLLRGTTTLSAGTLAATVGLGGAEQSVTNSPGNDGGDSSFNSFTAPGGGGGGFRTTTGGTDPAAGTAGGSGGGGGGGDTAGGSTAGGASTGGGNAGGSGFRNSTVGSQAGGGGGGAGGAGGNAAAATGGAGGAGLSDSINGTATVYAAGGPGSSNVRGSYPSSHGGPGSGGGASEGAGVSEAGQNGIVVVRWRIYDVEGTGAALIGAPAVAATGTVGSAGSITGDGAVAIGGPSLAASGTAAAPSFTGTAAISISAPAVSGAGTASPPAITGSGDVQIGTPALAGSGAVAGPGAISGTGAVSIAGPSLAGAGTASAPSTTGTGAVSIAAPLAAGSGAVGAPGVSGAGAVAILAPGLSGAGTVAPPAITGTASVVISGPIASGSQVPQSTGRFAFPGQALNGGRLAGSVRGGRLVGSRRTGRLVPAFPVETGDVDDGAVIIGRPMVAGLGTVSVPGITGAGAANINAPALAGAGAVLPPAITGAGAVALAGPVALGAGAASGPGSIAGTGAVLLPRPQLAGAGTASAPSFTGAGTVSIGGPALAGAGSAGANAVTGSGAVTIGGPAIDGESALFSRALPMAGGIDNGTYSDPHFIDEGGDVIMVAHGFPGETLAARMLSQADSFPAPNVIETPVTFNSHSTPAVRRDANGRLEVYWTGHNQTYLKRAVQNTIGDLTAWTVTNIESQLRLAVNDQFTYVQLRDVAGVPYLFTRHRNAGQVDKRYSFSKRVGGTWSQITPMLTGDQNYIVTAVEGAKVHFGCNEGHPTDFNALATGQRVYYGYLENDIIRDANGVARTMPVSPPGNLTLVYTPPSGFNTWTMDLAVDSSGRVCLTFVQYPLNSTTASNREAFWARRESGGTWTVIKICDLGLTNRDSQFGVPGLYLDRTDPTIVFLGRDDTGASNLQAWRYALSGATFTGEKLTNVEFGVAGIRLASEAASVEPKLALWHFYDENGVPTYGNTSWNVGAMFTTLEPSTGPAPSVAPWTPDVSSAEAVALAAFAPQFWADLMQTATIYNPATKSVPSIGAPVYMARHMTNRTSRDRQFGLPYDVLSPPLRGVAGLDFDGVTPRGLWVPQLNHGASWAFVLAIKPGAIGSIMQLACGDHSGVSTPTKRVSQLRIEPSGALSAIGFSNTKTAWTASGGALVAGTKYVVSGWFETSANRVRARVNGVQVASATTAASGRATADGVDLTIGYRARDPLETSLADIIEPFNGTIYAIAIWRSGAPVLAGIEAAEAWAAAVMASAP